MSITRTVPACDLPGLIHSPGLAAAKVAVARAPDRLALHHAGGGVDAAGHVGGDDRAAPASLSASMASATAPCGVPEKPVPSSASTATAQSARRAGVEGLDAVDALGVGARVAAQLAHRRHRQHAHLAAGLAQQPRGDVAVAAVVALAADDRDRPVGRDGEHEVGQALPGALHELQAGDALLLDRPAIGRAHALGVGQALQPGRQAHRSTATAAAVDFVCVSEMWTSTPSAAARAATSPCRRHARRPVAAADHLDVARVQHVHLERLAHGLLGAEARRQMAGRAPLRGRVGALAVGEEPLGQRAAGARARPRAGRSPGGPDRSRSRHSTRA